MDMFNNEFLSHSSLITREAPTPSAAALLVGDRVSLHILAPPTYDPPVSRSGLLTT